VIYLVTDSRESRWLPTVLSSVHNKICLTIALGFDTFVCMRHGLNPFLHQDQINGSRLGCYFCGDIVAPLNSLKDRTLDQQCTVSRPGNLQLNTNFKALCTISASYGVELLMSLINHNLKQGAQANENLRDCDQSPLGFIPQQIRGDLTTFNVQTLFGQAFQRLFTYLLQFL
jgi:ubiquitin-like modifier-activating enzyme ATG7